MKKKLNTKKFTLIELIIVIVVIGILAGMALPKFIGVERNAKVSAMDQDLDVLEKAVTLYESDKGEYPLKSTKITISDQTLKDTLSNIGDNGSEVYEIDMDKIQPYLEKLKFTNSTTDTYLYSTKIEVAINEQGKIDSDGNTHYILNNSLAKVIVPKLSLIKNNYNSNNSFIITNTNNLYGWGDLSNSKIPTNVSTTTGIKFLQTSSGADHAIAIGVDGELYAWGNNYYGELGDGTTVNKQTPTKITLANGVKPKQIACGFTYSIAIGSDNNLYTWGYNAEGQLGDGTTIGKNVPTKIMLPNGVKPKQIVREGNCMVIGDDGNLYAWGSNSLGALGIGTSDNNPHSIPTKVTFPNGVKPTKVSSGSSFSLAICDDKELYAWGYNAEGQFGNSGTSSNYSPIKITFPNGVKPKEISAGKYHSMAIGDDGELYTWGNDQYGQLGDGRFGNYVRTTTPTKITLASGVKPTQIACGAYHSMAIGDDKNFYTWGNNDYGQLGDNTRNEKHTPTKINFNFE